MLEKNAHLQAQNKTLPLTDHLSCPETCSSTILGFSSSSKLPCFLPCLFVMLPFLPISIFILKTEANQGFLKAYIL